MAASLALPAVVPGVARQSAPCNAESSRRSSPSSLACRPSDLWGTKVQARVQTTPRQRAAASSLTIEMAISRTKKEETIEKARKELEDCYCIAALDYSRFTVKQFQDLRRSLPEGTSMVVMKNTLLEKAVEGTPFAAIEPCLKGMNAFLFVHTEEIPPALKPYRDMQKELKLEDNDYTGAVFEGKFYKPEDMKALESMPTRMEIYAKLLGTLKGPSQQVVGVLQAPARDLVFTLKAYVQKLEQEQGGSA